MNRKTKAASFQAGVTQPERTSAANLAAINSFFDVGAELLSNLYGRWQDEREYENFADYAEVVKKALPEGFKFVSMSKRPFAVRFTLDAQPGATYEMYVNNRYAGWKRV